ncbi:hypothetical protein Bca52824_088849 [Brassica carinata]|uniref:Uncharacterized protein n=1 Tax=Brassica carinata TaxID=52824 RepID=A0A8X7PC59_BRACI|nr:hypothetical protein Bca52824_088849 [Brassica carinata]
MLSGLITLVIDSMATSIYSTSKKAVGIVPHGHGHGSGNGATSDTCTIKGLIAALCFHQMLKAWVLVVAFSSGIAHLHGACGSSSCRVHGTKLQVIDSMATSIYSTSKKAVGIVPHGHGHGSGNGATSDTCTIKGLIAALCFHQMFEGMGLGGCILQAEYTNMKKFLMAFFFAITTPFGIALGIALSTIYRDNSPSALITVGLLNACSAGLLIYMALVDLLAAEFMGPNFKVASKCKSSVSLRLFWGVVACRLSPNGLK